MTIRFAAATNGFYARRRLPVSAPVARTLVTRALEKVSNDNPPSPAHKALNDEMLRAALTHLAEHGLAAAHRAHDKAKAAGAGLTPDQVPGPNTTWTLAQGSELTADSPIVQAGSDDSVTASLVVTRAISFGF